MAQFYWKLRTVVLTVCLLGVCPRTASAQKIYFSDGASNKMRRAYLDGSDVEDLFDSTARGVALDLTAGKVYWTVSGIHRANLDGSDPEQLTSAPAHGIALDIAGGKMYWTDVSEDRIRRANLDGSEIEDLVTAGLEASLGIALDLGARQMYWVNQNPRGIQRANLDGSEVVNLVTQNVRTLGGLALDLSRGKMYWTADPSGPGTVIRRANLDGSNVETILDVGWFSYWLAIDSDSGKVYWTQWERIRRASFDGTDVENVVTGLDFPRGFALDLACTLGGPDCQANGIPDLCDVATGAARDCNDNHIPDECDIADGTSDDCNHNGRSDECEPDCNGNGIPDECDIAAGTSEDCNGNGIPDECEPDCNGNASPDDCDIADGTSADCTGNGIPDECEPDCNENGVADSCDIADGTSEDCTSDGVPDECEPDCNENGIPDSCDIAEGASDDCDYNRVPDECDLAGDGTLPCGIIDFAPGASTGPHEINGNEMIIPSGGVQVEYEILVSGWGNAPASPLLGAYNMVLDGYSLLGLNTVPSNPEVDLQTPIPIECGTSADCPSPLPPVPVTRSGTCGVIFPGWCDDFEPAFFIPSVCADDLATPCRGYGNCPIGVGCVDNPRFVFSSDSVPWLVLYVLGDNFFQWMGLPWVLDAGREDPDGTTKFVAGNLRLIVPEGAEGTYTIRFRKGPDFTFINDPQGQSIPSTVIHGQLTIGGACCMADGSCEVLLESDCKSERGAYFGGFCGGDSHNDGKVDICEVMGDIDGDGYVGLSDWLLLVPCIRGPGADVDGSQCTPTNLNRDTSVDLEDVALFIAGFTG